MSLSSLSLDAFFACAQAGSFTKAAEKLHITQSALSQRIANLEEELGTSLFIRERTGIKLTEQGSEILRYCQAKEALELQVTHNIARGHSKLISGHIRIGGFSSVMRSLVLPALADLLSKNPQVQITFLVREIAELPALLKNGSIDYMVFAEALSRNDLVAVPLGQERNVLVEKKNYQGADIYLDHDEEDQMTIKYLGVRSKNIQRRYFDDIYGLLEGVRLGLGRAVVPLHMIENEKGLTILHPQKSRDIPVVLHHYHQDYYSQLHYQVIEALKKGFAHLEA
jgi:DNA-binding transcriptional LysR family regulator